LVGISSLEKANITLGTQHNGIRVLFALSKNNWHPSWDRKESFR